MQLTLKMMINSSIIDFTCTKIIRSLEERAGHVMTTAIKNCLRNNKLNFYLLKKISFCRIPRDQFRVVISSCPSITIFWWLSIELISWVIWMQKKKSFGCQRRKLCWISNWIISLWKAFADVNLWVEQYISSLFSWFCYEVVLKWAFKI